ncbi:MAG: sigma 54-interacting transcriptional regulator [Planctomycetota bacterium]
MGPFSLTKELGAGYLGDSWLGQAENGAHVVVKLSRQMRPTSEFRLLAELEHPGVPRIALCGIDGGRFWVATHWLDGEPLEAGLPARNDEEEFAAAAAIALLYLASCGVIHGDVHPGNLLCAPAGYAARLLDFGLASDGEALPAGRRGFIAPEVLAGGGRTTASDLFGLGASLRDRGAARSARVAKFAEALTSPDPQVRILAAREFVSGRALPVCGPRRNRRMEELKGLATVLDEGIRPARGLLVFGEAGMGKTDLVERVVLEARARGWGIEREARGTAGELATRWAKSMKPLLVALDDLDRHPNAGEVSAAMEALSRAGTTGVLVVAAATGDLAGPAFERRGLGRLAADDIGAIFQQVTGVNELSPGDLKRLSELSGGSPRHAVAVARAVLTAGATEFRLGSWSLRPQAPLPVPIDAADAARPLVAALDRLAGRMLAAAALAGGAISRAALPVAVDGELDDIARLEEAGLVRPEGAGVVPIDAAVGSAATQGLSPHEKSKLHRRLAALTAEAGAPRWVSAWHWVHSGDAAAAAAASLAAAEELHDLGDLDGARSLLAAASELAAGLPADLARLDAAMVVVDSEERADEGIARRAEELAGRAPEESLRRRMAAVALSQWHRLRRWVDLDSAANRMAPAIGAWLLDRAAFAQAIRRSAQGVLGDAAGFAPDLDQCKLPAEARFLGWKRAMRGDFREAARAELRAVNLARRQKAWRVFGSAVDAAVTALILCGLRGRAEMVIAAGLSIASRMGRLRSMHSILGAQANLSAAAGEVGRGLGALHEYDEISTLMNVTADVRERSRGLRALLLRFGGRTGEALTSLGDEDGRGNHILQTWSCYPRCLSLLDLGRWNECHDIAEAGAREFQAVGDASGATLLRTVQILAAREGAAGLDWLEAARALPAEFPGDRATEGISDWLKIEADLATGSDVDLSGRVDRIVDFAKAQRLVGGEAAARLALSCASAGHAEAARRLLAALSPMPDSPPIEVWAAIAQARLEPLSEAALRHLEAVRALLPGAGSAARREWLSAAAAAGRDCGMNAEASSWERQREMQRVPQGSAITPEETLSSKSLASQTRHIRDIVREINAERDVPRLLDKVLDAAIAITGAERGCLVLVDGDRFEVRAARPEASGLGSADAFSRTISDKVILSGEPFYSGDALEDQRLRHSVSIPRLNVHSVVCIPFRLQRQTLGSLYLDHRRKADAFDPGALDALQTLADLAAVAIENAQLFAESGRQKEALAERARRLERRLEEVELQGKGDTDSGLKYRYPAIVGRSAAMLVMLRSLDRATDQTLPVLIQGETGVGKELVARAIHANGPLARGPFVAENCAAISPLLMESELFGHVKGAFSGASADHEGLFRSADGGVLLLDEIGELETGLQAKLLRVIEDGVVRPVGSDRSFKVRVRVLAATHRDLEVQVTKGLFRRDLFYRLASFTVAVPALRERREDIPELIRRFLGRLGSFELDVPAMKLLLSCAWPGNVRQLEHVASVLASGGEDTLGAAQVREVLGGEVAPTETNDGSLRDAVGRVRLARVQAAIVANDGRLSKAAKQLGMTYQGLHKIAAKHKLLGLRDLSKK